jgi:hypothetical protein
MEIDTSKMTEVGQNVLAQIVDGKLVLVIDTKVNLGPSSTGKMIGVASTGGFALFPGNLKGNIYLGRKNG